jgi:hypothetical protein
MELRSIGFGSSALLALGAVLSLSGGQHEAGNAPGSRRYHADPAHPWNRLHAAIARRTTAGGRTVGLDQADPLLWPDSEFLLEPARSAELQEALADFVAAGAESWIDAPLPRVLMQQDLWAVFDWACAPHGAEDPQARRELARALVPALARVAPTAEALEALPDNLALDVVAWRGPRAADPDQPQRPFLPDADWVLLGDLDDGFEPLARQHAEVFGGRSAFEVRIAVPGGREATLAWLATLRGHPAPTRSCSGSTCGRFDEPAGTHHTHLSADLPAPPPGTLVSLVRRALAFDDRGGLHVTRLVKGVQLRAFLDMPEGAVRSAPWEPLPGWPWQAVAELELRPGALLAGEAGGLRPIGPGEHAYRFLGTHGDEIAHAAEDFDAPGGRGHLDTCIGCHGAAGMLAFNSYTGFASGPGTQLELSVPRAPRRLGERNSAIQAAQALAFERRRFAWGVLWAWLGEERSRLADLPGRQPRD